MTSEDRKGEDRGALITHKRLAKNLYSLNFGYDPEERIAELGQRIRALEEENQAVADLNKYFAETKKGLYFQIDELRERIQALEGVLRESMEEFKCDSELSRLAENYERARAMLGVARRLEWILSGDLSGEALSEAKEE